MQLARITTFIVLIEADQLDRIGSSIPESCFTRITLLTFHWRFSFWLFAFRNLKNSNFQAPILGQDSLLPSSPYPDKKVVAENVFSRMQTDRWGCILDTLCHSKQFEFFYEHYGSVCLFWILFLSVLILIVFLVLVLDLVISLCFDSVSTSLVRLSFKIISPEMHPPEM